MVKSVTLLFPGQGSQYVGMGANLKDENSFSLFTDADKVLGYPLSKICFDGPEEDLKLTENTQPAIVTHSCVLLEKLKELLADKEIKIDRVLGHSVGEYAALVAAGVLSHADAIKAVHFRGKFMQEAVAPGVGKMAAIMRVPEELVVQACQEASKDDSIVMPANFNDPSQTVISGSAEAVDRAIKWLGENFEGRMRAIELKVSAPFHCSLMKPAASKLKIAFLEITFNKNTIPYIANIDAKEYEKGTKTTKIQENLISQVEGSVRWLQSIQNLEDDTLCIEVGPGKVLAGLVKKINPNIRVISLDTDEAFEKLQEAL